MARTINEIKSELELIKNSFYEEVEKLVSTMDLKVKTLNLNIA